MTTHTLCTNLYLSGCSRNISVKQLTYSSFFKPKNFIPVCYLIFKLRLKILAFELVLADSPGKKFHLFYGTNVTSHSNKNRLTKNTRETQSDYADNLWFVYGRGASINWDSLVSGKRWPLVTHIKSTSRGILDGNQCKKKQIFSQSHTLKYYLKNENNLIRLAKEHFYCFKVIIFCSKFHLE
ncbi:hypothetical protein EGR_00978 [Echinococcus granulosus]|uniref:Uncharacterized protein n=1 Tax=Echinococcus granulosus TaxID=6210 RepID=W6VC58_ECHGR|nr:hypothetical protein EGR_00978 [Echinococcus granulosus]EUB64434.1 hypothetical protein EGR_00978 [Echinococcus granulosus]